MELLVANVSASKPIGIGSVTILPGESKAVPEAYANHPILKLYVEKGFVRVTEVPDVKEYYTSEQVVNALDKMKTPDTNDSDATEESAPEDAAEALRKARLASLNGLDEAALGKLAEEIGINPADCKDTADMRKKVRAALKK